MCTLQIHNQFVEGIFNVHRRFAEIISDVFRNDKEFIGALDQVKIQLLLLEANVVLFVKTYAGLCNSCKLQGKQ